MSVLTLDMKRCSLEAFQVVPKAPFTVETTQQVLGPMPHLTGGGPADRGLTETRSRPSRVEGMKEACFWNLFNPFVHGRGS